jgi:MurNAc alpha-1-phosphate uridylyltransferase
MKAMILAAGRGTRLRPLTDTTPKPLLEVGGEPMIAHHLRKLAVAGITEVVVNTGWLGEQLPAVLGDGSLWGVSIAWSHEGWPALDTGGGIRNALPLLGDAPFLLINSDVWSDIDYAGLAEAPAPEDLGRLALVPNPPQHPEGDFGLVDGRVDCEPGPRWTYSGLAVLRPAILGASRGAFPLAPLLRDAAQERRLAGQLLRAEWHDVGTPERLDALRRRRGPTGN